MTLRFLMLAISVLFFNLSFAQDGNWKKLSKTAEQLYATGNYEEAASYYMEAYKAKNSNLKFLNQAADCYSKLRSYHKAANLYKEIKDNPEFPKAGLNYARSLKQNGDYEEAIIAFKNFLVNYEGEDSSAFVKIIKNEVEGCEIALSDGVNNTDLIIEHLSENINTVENEVAPVPFNDEILYFSSTMEGFSKIFRSQQQNGEWTKAVLPDFPAFENKHVCHGSFTPDSRRFYFTLCNTTDFDVVKAECDIYVTVRENGAWTAPRKLRDYIKLEGSTATHPYVHFDGDMEVLYFSSDRKGGKGGMDIWYMTRHVDSPEYDFTLPKNAGNNINTIGDEITPYYDERDNVLYFSSNGHPTMGGFDAFKSMGSMNKFSIPQNLGNPVNSSADDYYYVNTKSKSGGFIVSNRLHGSEKVTTDNDDIFKFSVPQREVFASGNVYDKTNNSIIHDVQIILYEEKENGQKRLLQSLVANNGTYQFALIPNRKFRIEAIKEGFDINHFSFNTFDFDADKEYGKSIYLDKEAMISSIEEPVFNEASSTASVGNVSSSTVSVSNTIVEPEASVVETKVIETETESFEPKINTEVVRSKPVVVNKPPSTSTTSYTNSFYQDMEVTTTAPKLDGVYYKVQILTDGGFNEKSSKYDPIRSMGDFQTEYISAKGWTRILLSEYFSLREAKTVMDKARATGFPEAFVVKYRNGRRLN